MKFSPWLTIAHTQSSTTVREFNAAFATLDLPVSSTPVYTVLVGRSTKSQVLRQLLNGADEGFLADHHGQIFLWPDPSTTGNPSPRVYIDNELQTYSTSPCGSPTGVGPESVRLVNWLNNIPAPLNRRKTNNLFCGRVLGPLCDTICYFASDLGGMRAVASLLAEQCLQEAASDLPPTSLPSILVVAETVSDAYSCPRAEDKLLDAFSHVVKEKDSTVDPLERLKMHFSQIRVVGIRKKDSAVMRARVVRSRLTTMRRKVLAARAKDRTVYRRDHVFAFQDKLLDHFCSGSTRPFSFVVSSRPEASSLSDFALHLRETFSLVPAEVWHCHLVSPLVESAIVLASYPPGGHVFPILWVYERCFEPPIKTVLFETVIQPASRQAFLRTLRSCLTLRFKTMTTRPGRGAVALHQDQLKCLQKYFIRLRSHKTCLCCVLRAPEKVLTCGHALCNVCISTFGRRSLDDKYSFSLSECPLCGTHCGQSEFQLVPPTAGIRVLSIDGGGIKGVIPLIFLRQLERKTMQLQVPLRDHFDFVCGTSAGSLFPHLSVSELTVVSGGLIIMGLFLMRWSVDQCLEMFEGLAEKTFKHRKRGAMLLCRVQQLAMSYLRDCQYSSLAIEEAFRSAFGTDLKMFNPLNNDTKVAVTTTTAKETLPCLFSNYNGSSRPNDIGYNIVRAARSEHDVSVSDAASCTSAAPWFFKSKSLPNLGTFQDGGLYHNNPLNIALWEVRNLWPNKSSPDFALSIGTGVVASTLAAFRAGPHSPVRDRFLSRLCRTFMRSLDGEKIWKDIFNSLPDSVRHRFHRLNLPIKGAEPLLDDLNAMKDIKEQAINYIGGSHEIQGIRDSVLASMFYFEFDKVPTWSNGSYSCTGNIFCRLRLPDEGRKALYEELIATSSYFLVLGQPIACVEKVSKSNHLFKRQIKFSLSTLTETVGITLRGITAKPHTISGLPKSADKIMKMQSLVAPFGRSDHSIIEKRLPQLPRKRKHDEFAQ